MKYPMTETTDISAEELIRRGYRRISNKYRMIARIDRADWVHILAKELRRAPADFYVPGHEKPAGNWCDFYRRSYSEDVLIVPFEISSKIPNSGFDSVGYIDGGANVQP